VIFMTIFYKIGPPVASGLGKINPQCINLQLLLDVLEIIRSTKEFKLPKKRSGYPYEIFILYQAFIQLLQRSPEKTGEWLNEACKQANISFQKHETEEFSNGKQRRYFPDQPALSRCLKQMEALHCTETFWNQVLFAHLLLLSRLDIINPDLILIADYKEEKCKKDKNDPYCFGTKEGKTKHKTLVFSVISNGLHQVITNFKIYKRQDKLLLFESVLDQLKAHDFTVKYALLDRGFYRKRILTMFLTRKITVIIPGRKCTQTKQMIEDYVMNTGSRYCKGSMKLKYVKGKGNTYLWFDILLVAKRKHQLHEIKNDYRKGDLTLDKASRRVFPLIVLLANPNGIRKLRGNESYIRNLYRLRWSIEIAFREMNKLGFSFRIQGRDARLGILGARSLLYNVWQVQRHLLGKNNPHEHALELDEFLGKTLVQRSVEYIPFQEIINTDMRLLKIFGGENLS
jgi:hypothetical protein